MKAESKRHKRRRNSIWGCKSWRRSKWNLLRPYPLSAIS